VYHSATLRGPDVVGGKYFAFIGGGNFTEQEAVAIGSDTGAAERFIREASGRKDLEFSHWQYLTAHRYALVEYTRNPRSHSYVQVKHSHG
jgi:hypothetical protein